MSLTSVQAKIKTAMKDSIITKAEAEGIVTEAEKNGVTFREGKAVADLFEAKQPPVLQPGQMQTMMVPEYPGDVSFADGARGVLQAFLDKNLIPVGDSKAKLQTDIKAQIAAVNIGEPLAKAPNVSRMFPVQLSAPLDMARDLPDEKAYVDLKSGKFFVRTEGGFVQHPGPQFYGPFQLPPAAAPRTSPVSDAKMDAMRAALNANLDKLSFKGGTVAMSHLGAQFAHVPLFSEQHPDGYTYTAYLQTGVVAPGAPEKNPETVNEMYIERTGGFAGLTEWAGPVSIASAGGN